MPASLYANTRPLSVFGSLDVACLLPYLNTGENIQGLRQVLDFTRLLSLAVLLLHCYSICHHAFRDRSLTTPLLDQVALNFGQLAPFQTPMHAKAIAGILLLVSLLGAKGKNPSASGSATSWRCSCPACCSTAAVTCCW